MSSRYEEIMKTKNYLLYKLNHLKDWMTEKSRDELNETDENREPAIHEMRKLVSAETDLNCRTDDAYFLQFLRARKFNVKRSFQLLKNFYSVKKDYDEIFPEEPDLETIRNIFETGVAGFLPHRDENGCVVLKIKLIKWNPDVHSIQSLFAAATFMLLMCVEDPATQVCGIQIVLDVKGLSFKQIRCITPRYIQLLSKALSNTLPIRFKGIHIINESFIFQYIYAIIKVFLSEKIKNRIHFHGSNGKHLQKYIPKSILTPEFGGDNIYYSAKEWCLKETPVFEELFTDLHKVGYCD